MKKYFLVITLILIGFTASYSQLTNAILAIQDGQIKIAKESIDKYMLKEKSPLEAKAWFYKGNIYESIAFTKDEEIKALEPKNALKITVEAYQKVIALDKPKGEWVTQATPRLENVWGVIFNTSIESYKIYTADTTNKAKLKESLELMTLCQTIKPLDTLAYNVAATIAIQGNDFKYAKNAYLKLIEIKYITKSVYKNLFYIEKEKFNNKDEALKILAEARKVYPDDKDFLAQEIDLYISLGKQQEAITKLSDAVKTDPSNAKVYYYNLGIIYKQLNDNVKSKESLQKSLAADSLYEGANYMMGFLFMDEGDVVNKKLNNMKLNEYNVSGKKEEAKRDALYKKSIPYLEKSYKVSKDEKLKGQLVSLYTKFKMTEKLKSIQ